MHDATHYVISHVVHVQHSAAILVIPQLCHTHKSGAVTHTKCALLTYELHAKYAVSMMTL
jgi:hypothetical protein